jgi:hydrogenase small subunit
MRDFSGRWQGQDNTMHETVASKQRNTIADQLADSRISRRRFLEFCAALVAAAPAGLALTSRASAAQVAQRIGRSMRPSVIWLQFQDCTGCTESLLHASQPDLADLIFDFISLDYHETLMAASGHQAEATLERAVAANRGNFVLVVEGSIPTANRAGYMKLAGNSALDVLRDIGPQAAFVIAIGSCSSWGGISGANPNPSNVSGVDEILKGKTVVNLPGCPPNPYTFLSVVLEYAAMHRLPALDAINRPKFAYDRLVHEDCPRRGHFDAGRFASVYGDEGHRQGWCLYRLGCKGPVTHAACSTRHFNDIPNCWPIGIGAPCIGCTEKSAGFRIPLFQVVDIHGVTPPEALPSVELPARKSETAAAVAVGALAGVAGTAAWMASRRLPGSERLADAQEPEEMEELEELERLVQPARKDIDRESR